LGLLCGAELSVIGLSLAVVLLVQFGAYAFAQLRLRNVARLMRSKRWSDGDAGAISAFERQFVQHSYVYFALPVGGVLGVGYGFARQLPAAELGRGTFGLITALIAAGVLTFLVLDSLHLTRILVEPSKVRRVMAKFRAPGLIVVEVPSAAITQPKGAEMLLDGAIMAADVRTLLLYNQHQMLGVLIMLLLIFSMALGYRPKPATLIGVVITVSIITAQLPYVVGQMRARAVVLGSSLGLQRQELKDSLDKHCPLFPSLPFWAAITAVSGSAGAFGAQLVEEALKGLVFPK
jgi:hypothetical protein